MDPLNPAGTEKTYPGCYRGVVVATEDGEELYRVRVRVYVTTPEEVPPEHCPYAEIANAGGKTYNNGSPAYDEGDEVWVMFEGGRRNQPVILGGIKNKSLGAPDTDLAHVGDYGENRKRRVFRDRKGNAIIMSEREDEIGVTIQSGPNSIEISKAGEKITIKSPKTVKVVTENAQVVSDKVHLEAVNLTQQLKSKGLTRGKGILTGDGNWDIDVPFTVYPDGRIRVGCSAELTSVPPWISQTRKVEVGPQEMVLGIKDDPDLLPTLKALLQATAEMVLDSGGTLDLGAVGKLKATAQGELELESNTKVAVTAPAVDVQSTGTVDVTAAGAVSVTGSTVTVG